MNKLDKILRDLRIYIDEERQVVSDNLHHKYGKEIKLLKLHHEYGKEMQANPLDAKVKLIFAETETEETKNRLRIAIKMLINCKIYLEGNKSFSEKYMKEIENIISNFSE